MYPVKSINFLFLISFLYINIATGQFNLEWAKSYGSNGFEYVSTLNVDSFGNTYSTGIFTDTVDFDPNAGVSQLSSIGGYDIFIQKLDASGNLIWAKSFGGSGHDVASSEIDKDGNIYSTGYFEGTVDFDPNIGTQYLSSNGANDIFILKLDPAGNFVWAKQIGGLYNDIGQSIIISDDGYIYTTGYFEGTVDFDPNAGVSQLSSIGGYDIFIQKLDTSGNFIWTKSMMGTNNESGRSITLDPFGNIYTIGTFEGTVDFDPSAGINNLTSFGNKDIFINKLDGSGNFIWAKSFGGTGNDYPTSITTDVYGNVYSTGSFEATVDFDPGPLISSYTAIINADIFIQKLDSFGNLSWVTTMGPTTFSIASAGCSGSDIITDNLSNVYTTGYFDNTVDFDPDSGVYNLTAFYWNGFIQKLDANGNFIWATNMSGVKQGITIDIDNDGNIFSAGVFKDTVDFDPSFDTVNLISNGNHDIFVQKLSTTNITKINQLINKTSIIIYPNPSNGQFKIELDKNYNYINAQIFNINGQLIKSQSFREVDNFEMTIDQRLGVYFLHIKDKNNMHSSILKIVLE